MSIEKFYYSITNVGKYDHTHFNTRENDSESNSFVGSPIYDIAFLSNDSYIVEYYEKMGEFCVRKNTNLSENLEFKAYKTMRLNDI